MPRKDNTGRLMRTLLFESSTLLLSELETLVRSTDMMQSTRYVVGLMTADD